MDERKPPGKPPKREPTTARSHSAARSWKREMLGRSAQQRVHDNFLISPSYDAGSSCCRRGEDPLVVTIGRPL
jgi:hypothetical protein